MKILITGGAGFIGSHLVRMMVHKYPHYRIFNLDKLSYAGNLANLSDLGNAPNYQFIKGDITDKPFLKHIFDEHHFDAVIHLAAESHVDRSITGPDAFVQTNVVGTANLLSIATESWNENFSGKLFYHISTDEVFGSLGSEGKFSETTTYAPRSPYSASKASSDHLVRAFHHTYNLPVVISNCSNNFGTHQFPEKLIPLMINNIKNKKPLPVYGKGENVRDWLWVQDHCNAMDLILHKGIVGETYCIGGDNEWKNIDLVKLVSRLVDEKLDRTTGESEKLISFITDRKGHDARYAIDSSKLKNNLGWKPSASFEKQLDHTIDWYLENTGWLRDVTSGEYQNYYSKHYTTR
ncbi:MAG: dTDP-glucose 4,6-dehydratase [Flavobacteriales bacterium]|nr:dTDP-glucose 4,6-dehydratase [Flavobacteriales bacterium]